jgi:hypothetical protein
MKNIIKKLALLTTVLFVTLAFSPRLTAAEDVDGWISHYSKTDSYVYPEVGVQYVKYRRYNQYSYGGYFEYETEEWFWYNNNLQPGFPTTHYNPFSYSFDNFIYTKYTGNDIHFEATATRLTLKNNKGSTQYVTITVHGTSIDSSGNVTGPFYSGISVSIPAYETVFINPFPQANYKNGSISWEIVD